MKGFVAGQTASFIFSAAVALVLSMALPDTAMARPAWKDDGSRERPGRRWKKKTAAEEPAPVNTAPEIGGSPAPGVTAGGFYGFVPTAADADGDTLSFTISGKPHWADFDALNGALYGTPADTDVGLYDGIEIMVSDGQEQVSLPGFSIDVTPVSLRSVTLLWEPPLENEDGTVLTNLAGYRIYDVDEYGTFNLVAELANPGLTRYVIEGLLPGIRAYSLTAMTGNGTESAPSNIAVYDLR